MKSVKNKIRNTLSVFLGLPQIIKSVSDISDRYSRMEKTWQMATTEIQDIGFRGNTKIIIASNLGKSFCKVYDLEFKHYGEVIDFSKRLQNMQVEAEAPYIDAPHDYYSDIDGMRRGAGLKKRKDIIR